MFIPGPNYYLLPSLPVIDGPTAVMPLSFADFFSQISENAFATSIVKILVLQDDLQKLPGVVTQEQSSHNFILLRDDQIEGLSFWKDFFAEPSPPNVEIQDGEGLLTAYFEAAASLARRTRCTFLKAWIGFEVALRNALGQARATALGHPEAFHEGLPHLQGHHDFKPLMAEWLKAPTPLAGVELIELSRWRWLMKHDDWYKFSDQELIAYGAKLLALYRTQRLNGASADQNLQIHKLVTAGTTFN
ncbi:MAG: hypothetical protein GX589_09420 [Deltaproteobacteria bacterium]|jgi:hypothetical protein|nr:hypothetical protein [Deltaproteobacteria bacterium]